MSESYIKWCLCRANRRNSHGRHIGSTDGRELETNTPHRHNIHNKFHETIAVLTDFCLLSFSWQPTAVLQASLL